MPDDVNPFEPWRPRPSPDDQVWQNWPARKDREPETEAEQEWYRSPRAPEPTWTPKREHPNNNQGFVWLSVVLTVAALITWGFNGGSHVSRVASALFAVWLGLLLAW